ncbi:DUF6587 family protein [Asticcacaulis solisilvae]|uniref:DUF6587 family protein n=1 Tax=Asticcacaulis solisilvae TaxID=1217274 RepID=UPI003FD7941D
MVYAVLQVVIIAAAVLFSLQHVARKAFPKTVKRLAAAVLPRPVAARVAAKTSEGGCGDAGGCGACNSCGNIAAMLRDVPRR